VRAITLLRSRSGRWTTSLLVALGLSVGLLVDLSRAQPPDEAEPPLSGFTPILPLVQQRAARPAADMTNFLDTLGTNDALIEVVLGQGRLLTLKEDLAVAGRASPVIAVGDPAVLNFEVVGPRQVRLIGQRIGVTDLAITTAANETYSFEVQVVGDLKVLRAQLKALFPDAMLKLAQIRDHVVVEGQARDTMQVARILETIEAYLVSVQAAQANRAVMQGNGQRGDPMAGPNGARPAPAPNGNPPDGPQGAEILPEQMALQTPNNVLKPQVINLIQVPGSQQVMLRVQIAELNRTAFRNLGASFLFNDQSTLIGTNPTGANVPFTIDATSGIRALTFANPTTTIAGLAENGKFQFWIDALRRNNVLKILAEPNLVAYHGHQGSFLAGGEFPVPVIQGGTAVGGAVPTVQFREFGVRLGFIPYIQDGDNIRLSVASEVSTIDFSLGTVIVAGGTPVPGLNSRKSQTTVELREGQTLAIAGLLQLTLDGRTDRIPGVGDLPVIGPFFSNNSNSRVEKELVVLVTPYLVEGMTPEQVPLRPGDDVVEPNDLEFYLLGRIEGRTGEDFRSTTKWDDPLGIYRRMRLEQRYVCGPNGYCD